MTRPQALVLGEWVACLGAQSLDPALAAKASDHLLDTVGAILAGWEEPPARAARRVSGNPGPAVGTSALGHEGSRVDRRDAAFVNGVAAHCLEIDDTEGCDHSGAVVVPVLLALQDDDGALHPRTFAALVAGYEVGRRVQLALGGYDRHNARGWHSTASCGVFAAASAAAVMLGLDGPATASALGIAASSSSGSWAFSADGAMTKQLHPGQAARAGLEAALLAEAGARGPWRIFEPVWGGFFTTHGDGSDSVDPGLLIDGLGSVWHFRHSAIKPYAACRSAHSAIDAFRGILADEGLSVVDVQEVTVHVPDFLRPMIDPPGLADAAQARMSLPVALALLLDGRELVPEDFESFGSAAVRERLGRIRVVRDPVAGREPLVEVRTALRTFASRVEHARGGERNPLSAAEVEAKFRRLTALRLSAGQQDEIVSWARGVARQR